MEKLLAESPQYMLTRKNGRYYVLSVGTRAGNKVEHLRFAYKTKASAVRTFNQLIGV